MLPLLEKFSKAAEPLRGKRIRALILVPTRELAVQVEASVVQYAKHTPLTSMAAYGGMDTAPQKERLIEGVDILVATPGRLLALASLPARRLQQVVGHARIVGVALVRRRSVHLGGHAALEIGHFLWALIDQQGIQLVSRDTPPPRPGRYASTAWFSLPPPRRRHDQPALPHANGRDQIHRPHTVLTNAIGQIKARGRINGGAVEKANTSATAVGYALFIVAPGLKVMLNIDAA